MRIYIYIYIIHIYCREFGFHRSSDLTRLYIVGVCCVVSEVWDSLSEVFFCCASLICPCSWLHLNLNCENQNKNIYKPLLYVVRILDLPVAS